MRAITFCELRASTHTTRLRALQSRHLPQCGWSSQSALPPPPAMSDRPPSPPELQPQHCRREYLVMLRHYSPRLLVTSLAWLLNDFAVRCTMLGQVYIPSFQLRPFIGNPCVPCSFMVSDEASQLSRAAVRHVCQPGTQLCACPHVP